MRKTAISTLFVLWLCQAQSVTTGAYYYWYSYNLAFARNKVLSACIAQNGYTCQVTCNY